jgi:hypothetical protein
VRGQVREKDIHSARRGLANPKSANDTMPTPGTGTDRPSQRWGRMTRAHLGHSDCAHEAKQLHPTRGSVSIVDCCLRAIKTRDGQGCNDKINPP